MEWACRMEFWRRFTMGTRRRFSRCITETKNELARAKVERGNDGGDGNDDAGAIWRMQDRGKEGGAGVVVGSGGDAGGRDSFEDRTGRVCAFCHGEPVRAIQGWNAVAELG